MIADLQLQNFRSYKNASFEFSPGVNIIVGPNASGKTNLLEAILVLAKGKSYRAKDAELIQFNKNWARLDTHLTNGSTRTLKLKVDETPSKLYELAGKQYSRLTLNNTLPVVLFEPNHLQLLSGSPERRRDYLDDLLEQTTAGYGKLRRQYRRALDQRNYLIKQALINKTQVFPWNVRLGELAGQIVRARTELTKNLDKEARKLYKELSKTRTKVDVVYQSRWDEDSYDSKLLKELEANLDSDRLRGFTSVGPHREDFDILFNNRKAQETASRGEIRTVVLTLKITELKLVEEARNTIPLLLLDDVFSELDGERRHALTDHISSCQTFITTTDADLVLQNFTHKSNVIALKRGSIDA